MKCLICGYNSYDFTGKDGGQVVGVKVNLATPSNKKGVEGLEVASCKTEKGIELPKQNFPFYAECQFDLTGRLVSLAAIPAGKTA